MNEVKTIPLISINVIQINLTEINNSKLVDEICSSRQDIDEKFKEDQHHTYYEDKKYPYGKPECEKLLEVLQDYVCKLTNKKLVLSEAWTLTLTEGQSVAAHSHKSNQAIHQEEFFSIAYYPSAPKDSADLIFLATACNTIENSIVITPNTGDLIIFNSYLMHMTNRHRNKSEERIVISANFAPEKPNTKPNQDWSAYARETLNDDQSTIVHHFSLVVSTIFGDEEIHLILKKDGTGIASNQSSQMSIPCWSYEVGVLKIIFDATVPMDTPVEMILKENGYGQLNGNLKIGEFSNFDVNGNRILV